MKKILIIILVIGFFLRVVDINNNPKGLYGDELTLVYDAYSILKTGHDQRGNFLPITFEMAGGRPGGYVYATVPFVAMFGPGALAARSVSILSGIGIILLMYFLGKKLVNERVGLFAAGLMAISPWSLSLSRGGFETNFALFLTLLGIVSFINSDKKKWLLIISAFSFGLSIHTYSTYKLTVPLILILLVWFYGFKRLFERTIIKYTVLSVFIFSFFAVVLLSQIFFGGSERRFLSINVFNQDQISQSIIQKINSNRNLDSVPKTISSLLHNKPNEYASLVLNSFIENISSDFLFKNGDGNPRHNSSQSGELYLVEIISVLAGVMFFGKYENRKTIVLIFSWILIAPIPASLLLETHALRESLLLPPMVLLSGLGFAYIFKLPKKIEFKLFKVFLMLVLLIQFVFVLDRIYFLSPNEFSRFWAYPAKQASNIVLENMNNYKYIILSDRIDNIEFAYPVYANLQPQLVIDQNNKQSILEKLSFRKFNNVYIGFIPDSNVEPFLSTLDGSSLYIGPKEDSKFLHDFNTINGADGDLSLVLKKGKK